MYQKLNKKWKQQKKNMENREWKYQNEQFTHTHSADVYKDVYLCVCVDLIRLDLHKQLMKIYWRAFGESTFATITNCFSPSLVLF